MDIEQLLIKDVPKENQPWVQAVIREAAKETPIGEIPKIVGEISKMVVTLRSFYPRLDEIKPDNSVGRILYRSCKPPWKNQTEFIQWAQRNDHHRFCHIVSNHLVPTSDQKLFSRYASANSGLAMLEQDFKDFPDRPHILLASLACRNNDAVFLKYSKPYPEEEKEKAFTFLESLGPVGEIGRTVIRKHLKREGRQWAEAISNPTQDPKALLKAADRIMGVYQTRNIEITTAEQQTLGYLFSKILADPPKEASVLLYRALKTNQKELFSLLLESGLNPNISIQTSTQKTPLAAHIIDQCLTAKDIEWLTVAMDHGLSDPPDAPLWVSAIQTIGRNSASNAFLSVLVKEVLKLSQPASEQELSDQITASLPFNTQRHGFLLAIFSGAPKHNPNPSTQEEEFVVELELG